MKKWLTAALSGLMLLSLCACAGNESSSAEGPVTKTARTQKDEYGNESEIKVTMENDKITAVEWNEYTNGEKKDSNYGKDQGEEKYKQAQDALAGSATYPTQLMEKQDINKVEAVTGATQSYNTFVELYKKAVQ